MASEDAAEHALRHGTGRCVSARGAAAHLQNGVTDDPADGPCRPHEQSPGKCLPLRLGGVVDGHRNAQSHGDVVNGNGHAEGGADLRKSARPTAFSANWAAW
eukprot:scaffold215460_cov30-Tisochrysis_lutea.AAC.1